MGAQPPERPPRAAPVGAALILLALLALPVLGFLLPGAGVLD